MLSATDSFRPHNRRACLLHFRQTRLGHLINVLASNEAMQAIACTRMIGCHLIEGAGHWVQQEQPQQVSHLLLQFVKQAGERENR